MNLIKDPKIRIEVRIEVENVLSIERVVPAGVAPLMGSDQGLCEACFAALSGPRQKNHFVIEIRLEGWVKSSLNPCHGAIFHYYQILSRLFFTSIKNCPTPNLENKRCAKSFALLVAEALGLAQYPL